MVQSVSKKFIERKSRKVDNKGKSDLMADRSKYGWYLGPLKRLKCHFLPEKVDPHPLKNFIGTPQKVDRFPSKSQPILSIIMPSKLNSCPLPSFVKYTRRRSNVNWPFKNKPFKYFKYFNRPFNYQVTQNIHLVCFISQDWQNRFWCNFEWSCSVVFCLSNGSINE
jgi:hypothetical protein